MLRVWTNIVLLFALAPISLAQSRIDCTSVDSRILHRSVRYCVMLPTNYDKETRKYPVLYFLHGLGENEQTLMRSGGWGLIEDLQRAQKIADFVMVAPEGPAASSSTLRTEKTAT